MTPGCVLRSEQVSDNADSGAVPVVITNVNVVPMESERILYGHMILVRDGVIEKLGPDGTIAVPSNAQRLDGQGAYLLPGLVDMHVHLRSESELLSYLAHGVTTIVHLSGSTADGLHPLRTRARLAAGDLLGPMLFTSGPILDGDPPIFASVSTVVTTPAAAKWTVEEQIAAGYDFIKVYNNIAPDVLKAVISTAHEHGRAVIGHIPRRGGRDAALQRALAAGLDVIAHGEEYFFTYFHAGVDSMLDLGRVPYRQESRIPAAVRMTSEAGAAVIPNLSFVAMTRRQLDSLDAVLTDPETRYLSPDVLRMWKTNNPTRRADVPRFDRRERAKYPFVQSLTMALSDAGIPLLLGTDASAPGLFPGRSAHVELEELVAAGLTPYEALATGTRNAGQFIATHVPSAPTFGLVAPGQRANLILVQGNPLADIRNAGRIQAILLHGRWLSSKTLALKRTESVNSP